MTSLLPFMPELPLIASGRAGPPGFEAARAGVDFAGLVDAAAVSAPGAERDTGARLERAFPNPVLGAVTAMPDYSLPQATPLAALPPLDGLPVSPPQTLLASLPQALPSFLSAPQPQTRSQPPPTAAVRPEPESRAAAQPLPAFKAPAPVLPSGRNLPEWGGALPPALPVSGSLLAALPVDPARAAPTALLAPNPERTTTAAPSVPSAPSAWRMRAALPTTAMVRAAHSPPASASSASSPPAVLPGDGPAHDVPAPPTPQVSPLPASIPEAAPAAAAPARVAASPPPATGAEAMIAQVGDLREALRAAQPAMTLRHDEFGMVSVRLEAAAPDQWRAVLASRHPGFVPAIEAALAERALAPAPDSAAGFPSQNGASQNGAGDHRYGASPNGGQGGSQPYLGQSHTRDGEAAPDQRRPSTAAAIAARGEEAEEDSAASPPTSGGIFA